MLSTGQEIDVDKIADMGRYNLAINLLEQIENKKISKEAVRYLTVLTYFGKGVYLTNLKKYIIIPEAELIQLLDDLKKWGYIDKETKITEEGKYILNKLSTKKDEDKKLLITAENIIFFPRVFQGVRK